MNPVLQLGPLVLPFSLLLVFAAIGAAFVVGNRLGRRFQVDLEGKLWQVLLAGLVCARLAFVWQLRSEYLAEPLSILDLRDGGWSVAGGFIGALLGVAVLHWLRRTPARPLYGALGAATAVWLAGSLALRLAAGEPPRLPELSLATLDGGQANLAGFAGEPTVINLWATWCPPCVREMPMLQRAQRDNPDINFVFVNNRESARQVSEWLAAQDLALNNVLLDTHGRAAAVFKQRGLPTTLFFDADGRLVGSRVGQLSLATLTRELVLLAPNSGTKDRRPTSGAMQPAPAKAD